MDANNINKDTAKSQIEKIRIDLEKKLAALEEAKLEAIQNKNSENEIIDDITVLDNLKKELDSKIQDVKEIPTLDNEIFNKLDTTNVEDSNSAIDKISQNSNIENNQSFIQQISEIENLAVLKNLDTVDSTPVNEINSISEKEIVDEKTTIEKDTIVEEFKLKDTIDSVVKNEEISVENNTFFEITDTIENVEPVDKLIKDEIKNVAPIEAITKKEVKKIEQVKKITPAVPTQVKKQENVAAATKNKIVETTKIIDNTEEKSNSKVLMYALGSLLFLGLGYFAWSAMDKPGENDSNSMLSEYQNRRYKDSIELADANNLILDFQSQRYIDSIAIANQIQFEKKSTKKKNRGVAINQKPTNPKTTFKNNTPIVTKVNEIVESNITKSSKIIKEVTEPEIVEIQTKEVKEEAAKSETTKKEEKQEPINEVVKPTEVPKKSETISTIEKSPVYPGCENKGSEVNKKRCLMSSIQKFVAKKFNSDLSQNLGLEEGRKKINVSFVIDKFGGVTVLKVRGQHKVLEKEALRVVNSLPKMKAGQKNGKAEPVVYNLPIIYKVEY